MESYRIDIAAKKMAMEFLEHGIYQLQQMFMQQSLCSFCCLFDDENINTQSLQLRENGMYFAKFIGFLKTAAYMTKVEN